MFTTKVDPSYDDLPEERYHFPATHLRAAQAALGGYAVYYEPRRPSTDLSSRGGRQAYFAIVRVNEIVPDRVLPGHYYAHVSDYLELAHPVPFRIGGRTPESRLSHADGSTNLGVFRRAVRELPDQEFWDIVGLGSPRSVESDPAVLLTADAPWEARRFVTREITRAFRDRMFREVVRRAYDNTCAVTGLRLVNGGGAAEIEAAHIHSVEAGGPDSPRNGTALSRTVHWMFDRFLFTVEDDLKIRLPASADPSATGGLVRAGARLIVPTDRLAQPHPEFLKWHRARFETKHGRSQR